MAKRRRRAAVKRLPVKRKAVKRKAAAKKRPAQPKKAVPSKRTASKRKVRVKKPLAGRKVPRKQAPRKKTARKPVARAKPTPRARAKPTPRARAKPVSPPSPPIRVDVAEQEALRAKFELGPHEWTRALDAREKAQTIPWGYGRDRVTAMAVDPERLFVYWEVTDEAIERARATLVGGEAGTLVLRVHDVTGLLFDGDNAHHSFDLEIGRAERQRFHWVGRPTSTVIVELGLRGGDGRLAAIGRSHRVDFPRRDPAPAGPIEWLTVREAPTNAGGERLQVTAAPPPPRSPGAVAASASSTESLQEFETDTRHFDEWFAESFREFAFTFDGQQFEWLGPTRDELFGEGAGERGSAPVASPQIDRRGGQVRVERRGDRWRVVQEPWSIEIRQVAARGALRLLARWELHRAWVVAAGRWRVVAGSVAPSLAAVTVATSEECMAGASELRLEGRAAGEIGGASEHSATPR